MPQISLYKDTSVSIGERGIDSVSMREIADTAGIQIGSLYQYFPNKELDDKKIDDLLILKYHALSDAKNDLGNIQSNRNLFTDMQQYLYIQKAS
jgi:AcrR family transcriptional regulator